MTPDPRGTTLLTIDEVTGLLGSRERTEFFTERGFLHAVVAAGVVCYWEHEVQALREAIAPAITMSGRVTISQAAGILGVTPLTVRNAVRRGLLGRDAQGFFDAEQVRALHRARRGRKPLAPPEMVARTT